MADAHTEPLLFHKAIELLPKKKVFLQKAKEEEGSGLNLTMPFATMLEKNMYQFLVLEPFLYLRLLIIQEMTSSNLMCKLLYSGFFGGPHLNLKYPLKIWIFNSKGALQRIETCLTACPKIIPYKKRRFAPQQSLSDLIGLNDDPDYSDPNDFQSTIAFLARHNKLESVQMNYCYSYHKSNGTQMWNNPLYATIFVEAFTTHNYKLGFRCATSKRTRKSKPTQKTKQSQQQQQPNSEPPNVKQANRSSAVSVKLCGLNFAFNLGILLLDQVKQLSFELGRSAVSIWMEYDELFNARYVTVSALNHLFQTEIGSTQSWVKVFDFIYKVKDYLTLHKRQKLSPILAKLSRISQTTQSPYKTCAQQLLHCIEHLTIVLFSSDDTCMHAIKFQLSAYLKEKKKKFNIIYLNSSATNTLTMLRTKELTFLNLNMYLDEQAAFKSDLPKPTIVSSIKRLSTQRKINPTLTVLALCKKRGMEIAPQLLLCWLTIGAFFIDHFELDIFSSHFRSISYLAFVAVWSKCARQAGIFHHGLEKTKAAYEQIFRNYSHGGYSFSCKDYLEYNQPMFGTHGEAASTLISLDIASSYGYAGSHIQTPTGFCNAYFDNGFGYLQLCEPFSRHNSFEFLSVYYTLYLLSVENVEPQLQIKTVYSNFHSTGLFYIKNYPLDLAVIFASGDIALFQFDGAYAHGCREGCQLFSSFVRGRKRSDLEADTDKRDSVINTWINETNEMITIKASYKVITDCHDDAYKMTNLKHAFYSIPILADLISGYPTARTCTKDDVLFSNDNLTFLIVLEGFIPHTTANVARPLLFKNQKQVWCRTDKTETATPMLLSKDVLCWLTKQFNFQVTHIHSVFFYKKCKVLNSIYSQLTLLRTNENISASVKQLVKNVVNFSAGYFGLNENKRAKTTFRLMSGIGSKFHTSKHFALPVTTINNLNFFIVGTARAIKKQNYMAIAPLPIYVFIVEFGKKRLSEIMCFFDKYLLPSHYRHLYSHVDNILFVLATDTIEEAVDPLLFQEYCKKRAEFFCSCSSSSSRPPLPGFLKQEICVTSNQEWKFVSPVMTNYCIKTNTSNETYFKCLFNNVTGNEAFDLSFKMLKKERLEVVQTRRIDKLLNKNVQSVTYTFNKKN
jgi:hypothetical protein